MKAVALVVDKAILTGSGSGGQPEGIDEISGLDITTYATSLSNASIANVVAVEQALDDGNAPDMGRAWVVLHRTSGRILGQNRSGRVGSPPGIWDG